MSECSACTNTLSGRRVRIGEDRVCIACLTQLFEIAIQDETEYPAHWGSKRIDTEACLSVLPADVVARYDLAGREYDTPASDRVYCRHTDPPRRPDPCNAFVGAWRKRKRCARCERCRWYTCLRCEESFSTSNVEGEIATIEHDCNPEREKDIHLRPLRGLLRGKDYQHCPNQACKRVWSLHDGCNHMRCACKTHFCFICGKIVRDGQGHWRSRGGCPRWNFPGDKNAYFDDNDEWNDNELADEEDVPIIGGGEFPDEESARRWQEGFRTAVAEGRVYMIAGDPIVRDLISDLTMHLDPTNNYALVFRNKRGHRVTPLEGLSGDQLPQVVVRPHFKERRPLEMLPEAINHAVLRMFGLKKRVILTPGSAD